MLRQLVALQPARLHFRKIEESRTKIEETEPVDINSSSWKTFDQMIVLEGGHNVPPAVQPAQNDCLWCVRDGPTSRRKNKKKKRLMLLYEEEGTGRMDREKWSLQRKDNRTTDREPATSAASGGDGVIAAAPEEKEKIKIAKWTILLTLQPEMLSRRKARSEKPRRAMAKMIRPESKN